MPSNRSRSMSELATSDGQKFAHSETERNICRALVTAVRGGGMRRYYPRDPPLCRNRSPVVLAIVNPTSTGLPGRHPRRPLAQAVHAGPGSRQAVEKLVKAVLAVRGVEVSKTHDV